MGPDVAPALGQLLDALATREATDRAGIALAFVLAHPSKPVALLGSQSVERMKAAQKATELSLTRSDIYALIEAAEGVPLP